MVVVYLPRSRGKGRRGEGRGRELWILSLKPSALASLCVPRGDFDLVQLLLNFSHHLRRDVFGLFLPFLVLLTSSVVFLASTTFPNCPSSISVFITSSTSQLGHRLLHSIAKLGRFVSGWGRLSPPPLGGTDTDALRNKSSFINPRVYFVTQDYGY